MSQHTKGKTFCNEFCKETLSNTTKSKCIIYQFFVCAGILKAQKKNCNNMFFSKFLHLPKSFPRNRHNSSILQWNTLEQEPTSHSISEKLQALLFIVITKSHQNSLFFCLLIWQTNIEMSQLKQRTVLGRTQKTKQPHWHCAWQQSDGRTSVSLCCPLVFSRRPSNIKKDLPQGNKCLRFRGKHCILLNMYIYMPTCGNSFKATPILQC